MTYPKVESVIKAPLSNIFHTNTESNDFLQSEMFAHTANCTDNEHPTLRPYMVFFVAILHVFVESKAANEWLIKKSKHTANLFLCLLEAIGQFLPRYRPTMIGG